MLDQMVPEAFTSVQIVTKIAWLIDDFISVIPAVAGKG